MDVRASAKAGWHSAPGVLFALLFCINALNYTDRYVLPAVASLIQPDLSLSDTQLGLLGTAFLLVYALTVLPARTIADRSRRTGLLSGGIAFWSLATLLTGITRSFSQIFAARALLGIGEPTYSPASTTLIAVTLLCTHLFGEALAPSAIGALSDSLGSLQHALLITPVALLAAGLVGLIGYRWVGRDRQTVVHDGSTLTVSAS